MMLFKRFKIRSYEQGLYFRDGEFKGLLAQGRHWLFDPLRKVRVDVVSLRDAWLAHDKLDMIVKSGALKDLAIVLDLKDHQRGLVWIEGRFSHLLAPGLYAYWHGMREVRVEVIDVRRVRFEHEALKRIANSAMAKQLLDICTVGRDHVGVLFIDGRYVDTLSPGLYAFWKGTADARVVEVDMRDLMNKITEAKKAAEAHLISRREETTAMRSQANTAKLLADNPTLMRLRELEVLEKIASASKLNVVLGEKGLAERVVNLL